MAPIGAGGRLLQGPGRCNGPEAVPIGAGTGALVEENEGHALGADQQDAVVEVEQAIDPHVGDGARVLGMGPVGGHQIAGCGESRNAALGRSRPDGALSILDQTFTIMGQKLGAQELNRADVVIRPAIAGIGAADFNQKHQAMLEGERAAKAALPEIQRKLAAWRGGGGR